MRQEVVAHAEQAIYETMTIIGLRIPNSPPVDIALEFDEISLEVEIEYEGPPFELATRPPAIEEIGSDEGVVAMASYLVRQYADRVRIKSRDNRCRVLLHFEH
jgi:hypothetical protein